MWALGFYLRAKWNVFKVKNSKISPKGEAVFEQISLILFQQRFEYKQSSWSSWSKVNVVPFGHGKRWTNWNLMPVRYSVVCILISSFCFCSSKEWASKAHSCNWPACIKENFNIGTLRQYLLNFCGRELKKNGTQAILSEVWIRGTSWIWILFKAPGLLNLYALHLSFFYYCF